MQNDSCMTAKDVIEIIFQGITALTILGAAISYKVSQKNLYLSAIAKCIQDFRAIEDLSSNSSPKAIKNYVGLVNEELLYFENGYLPSVIAREWIDGMLDFMPITNRNDELLNTENCNKILRDDRHNYLKGYARIRMAFAVRGSYNFKLIYSNDLNKLEIQKTEREKLIKEILRNLGVKYSSPSRFRNLL